MRVLVVLERPASPSPLLRVAPGATQSCALGGGADGSTRRASDRPFGARRTGASRHLFELALWPREERREGRRSREPVRKRLGP